MTTCTIATVVTFKVQLQKCSCRRQITSGAAVCSHYIRIYEMLNSVKFDMVMIFILFALYFWLSPEMHYTIVQLSPINLSLGSNQIRQPLTSCCIEMQKCILIHARLYYECIYTQCIVELHFRINTY